MQIISSPNDSPVSFTTAQLAAHARNIPVELVNGAAEMLFEEVANAIKANGLPDDVLKALELARVLTIDAEAIEAGTMGDKGYEGLLLEFPEAMTLIHKMGGSSRRVLYKNQDCPFIDCHEES